MDRDARLTGEGSHARARWTLQTASDQETDVPCEQHHCGERPREERCEEVSIQLSASMAPCVPSEFGVDSEGWRDAETAKRIC